MLLLVELVRTLLLEPFARELGLVPFAAEPASELRTEDLRDGAEHHE